MKVQRLLIISGGLALLIVETALAGDSFDTCVQHERRLRAAEADQCTGMSYIFNPSACFITRKELAPFAKGKCKEIAQREGLDPQRSAPVAERSIEPVVEKRPEPVIEKTVEPVAEIKREPVKAAAAVPPDLCVTPAEKTVPVAAAAVAPSVPVSEIEMLRREVVTLRIDVENLKSELKRLRRPGAIIDR